MLGIVIAAIGLYYFSGEIFAFLAVPYRETFGSADLIGTGPAEAFLLKLKMAALLGVIVASPLIFYQVWLFVEPGLLQEEKKLAVPFVLSTTALFLTGVCFCLYVVFPFAYEFFAKQYASIAVTPTIKIQEHLSFVGRGVLAFGVVFESVSYTHLTLPTSG